MKASFDSREIRDEVLSTYGNVISIETDVNLGGAGDHVMQNIHKENEEGRRERAALFDTSMEVNTKGI
jgi:GT2 family glycosyltransferase